MSRILLERVALTPGIPAPQKAVLIVLAHHAWHDGTHVYPSQETIARLAGMTERNARRCLVNLEAAGFIVPVAHKGGGWRHTVEYAIRLDKLAEMGPAKDVRGDNLSALSDVRADKSACEGGHFVHEGRTNLHVRADKLSDESGERIKDESMRENQALATVRPTARSETHSRPVSLSQKKNYTTQTSGRRRGTPEPGSHEYWAQIRADQARQKVNSEQDADSRAWLVERSYELVRRSDPKDATRELVEVGVDLMVKAFTDQAKVKHYTPSPEAFVRGWFTDWKPRAQDALAERSRREAEEAERVRREAERQEAERRWRAAEEAEEARRAALTPEERAREDAEREAERRAAEEARRERQAERMAFMRRATAPRAPATTKEAS